MSKTDMRSETSKNNIRKAQQSKAKTQREEKIEYLSKKKRLTKKEEEWLKKWKKDDEEEEEEEPKKVISKQKKEEPKVELKKKTILNKKKSYEIEEDDPSDSSDEEEIIIRPNRKVKHVIKKNKDSDDLKLELNELKELVKTLSNKSKDDMQKQPQINIINPGPTTTTQTKEVSELQKKILLNF